MKKGLIVYVLLAMMALPVLLQSCAGKKCGCGGSLHKVSPYPRGSKMNR
jgi:hypothetical protein